MTKLELVDQTSSKALTNYSGGDPFASYANAVCHHNIVGKLLKFSKGDFVAGEDLEEVPEGTTFTANLDELMVGWVRWEKGKPTDHAMERVADGQALPKRNDLGDTDESTWEADNAGAARDPWQFCNYLLLMDEASHIYTFTTSSRGGLSAIADLCRKYGDHRRKHPDDHLVVALGVSSYQHKKR
jgi:hypothetical protein